MAEQTMVFDRRPHGGAGVETATKGNLSQRANASPRQQARHRGHGADWWTRERELAFRLFVVEGKGGVTQVAKRVGVDRVTFWDWRQSPEWKQRREEHFQQENDEITEGIRAAELVAVKALKQHVRRSPRACISFLVARGRLESVATDDEEAVARGVARSGRVTGEELITLIKGMNRVLNGKGNAEPGSEDRSRVGGGDPRRPGAAGGDVPVVGADHQLSG